MAANHGCAWGLFIIIMVAVLPGALSTRSKYIVTAPIMARRGYLYTINVALLLRYGPTTVEVALTDLSNQVVAGPVFTNFLGTFANEQMQINILLPTSLVAGKHYLKVESKSGVVFNVEKDVEVLAESGFVLIQTDKQMYKEGQKVQIRAAIMSSDLRPMDTGLDLIIKDPKQRRLAHHKGLVPQFGVVTVDFQLVNDPELGEWTIEAMGTSMPEISSERKFKVEKYVLPKYSVEAKLPGILKIFPGMSKGQLVIDVTAKYTYGKPVNGRAILQLTTSSKLEQFEQRLVNGMTTFNSTVSRDGVPEYYRYAPSPEIKVKVTVQEDVTDKTEEFEGSVPMFFEPYKIAFINDDGAFVYGMPLNIYVKVTDSAGGSIPDAERAGMVVRLQFAVSQTWAPNEELLPSRNLTMPTTGDVIVVQVNIPTKDEMKNQTFKITAVLMYNAVGSTGVSRTREMLSYKYPVSTITHLGINVAMVGVTDQIQSPDTTVPAGQDVTFRITTTVNEQVFYEIHAKGILLRNGIITLLQSSPGVYIGDFDVPVTSKMAPKAAVVVYVHTPSGEVIADSQIFSVSGLLKHSLNVRFNNDMKQVGDIAEMSVTAEPNSMVFVSAIDKKAALLGKPNNIGLPELLEAVEDFDLIAKPKDNSNIGCAMCGMFERKRREVQRMHSSSGVTTSSILRDAGVMMMTDALITDGFQNNVFPEMVEDGMIAMAPMDDAIRRKGDGQESAGANVDSAATVRKNFPETWIWTNIPIGNSGFVTNTPLTVPDSITSWVVNAFSMNTQTGLDLDLSPPSLTVMKNMFVSLSLPFSVVRGEKFKLNIYVFSYFNNPIVVDVTLSASNDFATFRPPISKEILDDPANAEHVAVTTRGLQVASNSSNGFFLWIYPKTLGNIKLRITAVSPKKTDIVEQSLLVEPEGTTKEVSNSFIISNDVNKTLSFSMETLPEGDVEVVAGSKAVYLSVTGDVMGPTIDNLDRLVRQPCGCGEQNMITLVPSIFVRKYLEAVRNEVDEAFVNKTNQYMESGYQKEQTYKHSDGSYSAFGESDPSGSTWLTGFVIKSFAMAEEFIPVTVNEIEISESVAWLLTQLDEREYIFLEPGKVIHTEMKGGADVSKYSLTAVIYIGLMEARAAMTLTTPGLDTKLPLVLRALEDNYERNRDSWVSNKNYFRLAVMAYAFALGGSSKTSDVLQDLDTISTEQDEMKFWTTETSVSAYKNNGRLYCGTVSTPSDIETASYVVLAYTKLGNAQEAEPINKWLLSQLKAEGSYHSTQDTVLGLQAIAELAILLGTSQEGMNINIDYSTNQNTNGMLTVNDNNKLLLQKLKLPDATTNVTFSIIGKGKALLTMKLKYNIMESPKNDDTKFYLTTVTEAVNNDIFDLIINFQLLDPTQNGGMALVTYQEPSGFSTDVNSITDVSRKEVSGKTVTLYIDSLQMQQRQLRLQSFRTEDVADVKNGVVSIEMYYDPVKSKTVAYELPDAVKLTACQLSGDMDDVCPKPRDPSGASSVTPSTLLLAFVSVLMLLTGLN